MTNQLRIAVAEDDIDHLALLERALKKMGHVVVGRAATGRELVEVCRVEHPGLVITDIRMPDMDGLDAAQEIYEVEPVPIIVATSHFDVEFVERAEERHIMAFLVKPLDVRNLAPAIAIVLRRFAEFQALKQENACLVQALEERKVVERAKGLLMKQLDVDEPEAFKRLQKIARDKRRKLAEVAQVLVAAAEMMGPG
ncbi:MAG: response regulator [Planctomycetota bacterium]